jgi:TrmH RNA methyltransferase
MPAPNRPSNRPGPRDAPRNDYRDAPRDEQRPEMKICGVNACHAVAARRPDDVRRVYIHSSLLPDFGQFLKHCAAARVAYHVVEHAELERITQSTHHEGVCFIARDAPGPDAAPAARRPGPALPRLPRRRAEPAQPRRHRPRVRPLRRSRRARRRHRHRHLDRHAADRRGRRRVGRRPRRRTRPPPLAEARRAGYRLLATAARVGRDLYAAPLPARTIIMLGSETHGVSPAAHRLADESVKIPGTGRLDSLNVACACSIMLGEHWRTTPRPPEPGRPS